MTFRSGAHLVFSYCLLECVVVTRVVCELALGEPDDVRAHTVQEVLTAETQKEPQRACMVLSLGAREAVTRAQSL